MNLKKKTNVIIFTWSGKVGGVNVFKGRVIFNQDGLQHRRKVTSSGCDYLVGEGGAHIALLPVTSKIISINIHVHYIFLMTVIFQLLSIR